VKGLKKSNFRLGNSNPDFNSGDRNPRKLARLFSYLEIILKWLSFYYKLLVAKLLSVHITTSKSAQNNSYKDMRPLFIPTVSSDYFEAINGLVWSRQARLFLATVWERVGRLAGLAYCFWSKCFEMKINNDE
jgi:hypothetical protein